MTTYVSNQFAAEPATTFDEGFRARGEDAAGRKRTKRMHLIAPIGTSADYLVLGRFKSADRLYDLKLSCDGASTAGAGSIGLWEAPVKGVDPTVAVDLDLFASAIDIATAAEREDAFLESGTLNNWDRGKRLWELADIGGATYAEDPRIEFLLVFDVTAGITVAAPEFLLEADFVAAG